MTKDEEELKETTGGDPVTTPTDGAAIRCALDTARLAIFPGDPPVWRDEIDAALAELDSLLREWDKTHELENKFNKVRELVESSDYSIRSFPPDQNKEMQIRLGFTTTEYYKLIGLIGRDEDEADSGKETEETNNQ